MDIFYLNNAGKKINMDGFPIAIQDPENLFAYEWDYETKKSTITSFTKDVAVKNVTLSIFADSKVEFGEIMNNICAVTEADIISLSPGKLYVNGYYMECYINASEYTEYEEDFYTTDKKVQIVTAHPFWIKEELFSFARITNVIFDSDGLDYDIGYSYDYSNSLVNQKIINNHYAASDFEMTIYGSCENPHISIGAHTYTVAASLITGEFIKINSITKKIYKVKNNGENINLFHYRGRDFNIFEKIPTGILNVAWGGGFGFDIKLLQERSEPEWI